MIPSSSEIKRETKRLLAGKWPLAIASVFVVICFYMLLLVLYSLFSMLFPSGLFNIVLIVILVFFGLLIGCPLFLGGLRIFRSIYSESHTDLYEMFYYFSTTRRLIGALQLSFLLLSKFVAIGFLLLLPSIIINLLSEGKIPFLESGMPIWFSNLWVFGNLLRNVAIVLLIVIILRHYLCAYIFIQNDNLSAMETLLLAKKVSKTSLSGFFGLFFSFIGWLFLSFFMVPLIFTIPYAAMAYIVHCAAAINYYNRTLKSPTPFSDEMDFDL